MSNKKRIRKRIIHLESKQHARFLFGLKIMFNGAKNAVRSLEEMAVSMTSFVELSERILNRFVNFQPDIYTEDGLHGFYDSELEEFVIRIRALTNHCESSIRRNCSSIPKAYWKALEGLIMAGFSMDDAIQEVVVTYKL